MDECIQIGITLADAVEHLHRNQLVHRDIKPSNVIFVGGRPKLADIGLVASLGEARTMVGTEGFVAPEGPGTPQADIVSLGKLLYEIATGHDRGKYPAPVTSLADSPDRALLQEINEVILRACEPDPARRYASMAALRAELLLVQAGESLRRSRAIERHFRRFRRGAVVGLGLILIGATGFLLVQRERVARLRADLKAANIEKTAQEREAALDRDRLVLAAHLEAQRVEEKFANDRAREAVAYLAQSLQRDPSNHVAAERLLSALTDRTFARPLTPSLRHEGNVEIARWSRDGERVVTASRDGTARVWDARTGQPVTRPLRHRGPVRWADFSPDGGLVVTASDDGTAQVWDVGPAEVQAGASGRGSLSEGQVPGGPDSSEQGVAARVPSMERARRQVVLSHQGPIVMASFSPDGLRVVTASADATARIWDARSGEPIGNTLRHAGRVNVAQFSRDGRQVVTASDDGTARVWDTETGQPVGGAFAHEAGVAWADLSPNGLRVVTAGRDGSSRIWETRTASSSASVSECPVPQDADAGEQRLAELVPATGKGRKYVALVHQGPVVMSSFSADGLRVVTASEDGTARIWDARDGQAVTGWLRHGDRLRSARFSPDGLRVVTSAEDRTARVWDAFSGQPWTEPFAHGRRLTWAEFSADGERVVTSSEDSSAGLWDVRPNRASRRRVSYGFVITDLLQSADGARLLVGLGPFEGVATNWLEVKHAEESAAVFLSAGVPRDTRLFRLSRDGRWALAVSGDGVLRVWDIDSGKLRGEPRLLADRIQAAEFSPDSTWVVTGGTNCVAQIWEVASGARVGPPLLHEGEVRSARFSPDGRKLVTASMDGMARIWSVPEGPCLHELRGHEEAVNEAEFSPNGQRVVTASADATARIWEAETGRTIGNLLWHERRVLRASFNSDGSRVLTLTEGGSASLWEAGDDGSFRGPLALYGRFVAAEFSPDGGRVLTVATPGQEGARLWDAMTGRPLSEPMTHQAAVLCARFSPNGRRVVTGARDGTTTWWEAPRPPDPVPAWLPELALLLAADRMDTIQASRASGLDPLRKLRAGIEVSSADDFYGLWGRWYLASGLDRPAAPFAPSSVLQYLERQMFGRSPAPLLEVMRLQPTNSVALSRLAAMSRQDELRTNALLLAAIHHHITRLAERNPDDRVVLWAAIDVWANAGEHAEGVAAMDRVIARQPDSINGWAARGVLFDRSGRREEAQQAYAKALECATASRQAPDSLRRTMLLHRAALLRRLRRCAEAVADYRSEWNIPPRDPALEAGALDLSAFYNAALDEAWYSHQANGNRSLQATYLPATRIGQRSRGVGWQDEGVGGVWCDMRGLVQLASPTLDRDAPGFPRCVEGIPVRRRASRLCFVHAASGVAPDGTILGCYVMHFGDGRRCEIPIRYGEEVRAWRVKDDPATIDRLGWEYKNEPNPADEELRLFVTWWSNPWPEVEISRVDLVSRMAAAAPFLVAITCE